MHAPIRGAYSAHNKRGARGQVIVREILTKPSSGTHAMRGDRRDGERRGA